MAIASCCCKRAKLAFGLAAILLVHSPTLAESEAPPSNVELAAATLTATPQQQNQPEVARLIDALGNSRYVARREAEQQLLEVGMKAFDQIDAASRHPDPEVAASCQYIISELTVHWTRRDDPPKVKQLLEHYAELDEPKRLNVVEALQRLSHRKSIAPLCRICRFDSSLVVSRQAAVALLHTDRYEPDYDGESAAILRAEIGSSIRPAATWVRLLADQIQEPAAAADQWIGVIDIAAAEAAAAFDDETYTLQVLELLRNLARLQLKRGDAEAFTQSADQVMELSGLAAVNELRRFFDWAAVAGTPQLVDELLVRYEEQLSQSKAGLYLMALTRAKQDQVEMAQQLADRAFEISGGGPALSSSDDRMSQATMLIEEGQIDWGRREYRQVIKEVPVASDQHSLTAVALAESLHDWQQDEEAAEVLAAITDALRADVELMKQYENRARNGARMQGVRQMVWPVSKLESYQFFYEACHLNAEGDTEQEWQALERALKRDSSNADIIIAKYHASTDNSERRKQVMKTIRERCRSLEQSISDYPSYSSNWHNEWAWLVSNTEGDFDKAVRFSHKSLDLFAEQIADNPSFSMEDSAGLLDTLGRCYFAAGDIESAIKYQSQAVEYEPHMRVLQRQLKEFEDALASNEG